MKRLLCTVLLLSVVLPNIVVEYPVESTKIELGDACTGISC